MSESANRLEADLARERSERLQHALAKKRWRSIAFAVVLPLTAVVAWTAGFGMVAFGLLVLSLISLLRYFDANSHLHEVRRRSAKSLAPNFSLVQPKKEASDSKQSRAVHEG